MRTYQPLSQNDPQWSNINLGNSSSVTIGQAGCYITSFAILSTYFGHPKTPAEINQMLKGARSFAQDDLVSNDNDLSVLFPDIVYQKSYYFPNQPPTPADLNLLKDLLADPTVAVIVMIALGKGQVHFTPALSCDGVNVTIQNVWDGKIEDLKTIYGDPATVLLKYVVYKGTPMTYVQVDSPTFTKLVKNSTAYDAVCDKLGFAHNTDKKLVLDKLDALQTPLSNSADSSTIAKTVLQTDNVTTSLPDQTKVSLLQEVLQKIKDLANVKIG